MEILCFFAGIAFIYTKAVFPLLLLALILILRPRWSVIVWFLVAMMWGFIHQCWVNDKGMPDAQVIPKASLQGTVISLPSSNPGKTQFKFFAQRLNNQVVQATILLSCYQHCPIFKAGQVWHLDAKLKKPDNLANPGSFDYVGWLKANHIQWTGYIKRGSKKLSDAENNHQFLLVFREKLALALSQTMPKGSALGILQALTLGVTSNISKEQWDLFRRTGTTHLMVISGSHIGLIAGFSYWLMKWFWSRSSRLCLYCPAAQVASVAGVLMALIYALLAGFGAPAQRSLLACFFLLLRNFLSFRLTVWQAWRYGLLAVLLFEPHTVLLPGFYLSFIAVAILILINQRVKSQGVIKTIYIQLACLFGLMPLSLYWFSYGALNDLIANLLAIPLVGFVIVPLALIQLFLLQCFNIQGLMVAVNWAIESLLFYLHWVDSFAMFNLNFSFTDLLSPLALMMVMLVALFMPIKALFPALIVLFFSAIFPAHQRVKFGEARIDILDVGQGLAVVINTANHILIYDTGMKFYQGGDMAKLAIIPYLNILGIKKLDKVVISHPDLDHRGGLVSLEEKYPIGELLVDKVAFYHRGKACHNHPTWQWDGVSFQFLAITKKFRDKNNSSCILQIKNSEGSVLLTGDIEKLAEDYLVATYGKQLQSDILLIPHHGSKTSSSSVFIRQVAPQYAVISSGFDNRYHFPHQQTINTLQKQKIAIFNTSECGMVSVTLSKKDKAIVPHCYKVGRG